MAAGTRANGGKAGPRAGRTSQRRAVAAATGQGRIIGRQKPADLPLRVGAGGFHRMLAVNPIACPVAAANQQAFVYR